MLRSRSALPLAATVALLAVIAPGQPVLRSAALAATTAFEVPTEVPSGTTVRVSSGSDAMTAISDTLKTSFEETFNGAEVSVDPVGADQAIDAVLNGDSDLAAISRPLSDAEVSQGLLAESVKRIKIAVIVGTDNPFAGSLTGDQFAEIFRGEITNWSEVGGPDAPIRLIDRPNTSDTRLALSPYPVFKTAEFATGSTATQVSADSTASIAQELGNDGISYALFSEVENLDGVKVLAMHQTLPTDARYPFSQPFSYVYKGDPSPGVSAFLGYAAGQPGQAVLESANPLAEVAAGNAVGGAADTAGNATQGAADAAGNAVAGAVDAAGNAVGTAGDAVKAAADTAGGAAGDAIKDVVGAAGDAGNAVGDAGNAAGEATGNAVDSTATAADAAAQAGAQVNAAADDVAAVSDRNPTSQYATNLWWLLLIPAACFAWVGFAARRRREESGYAVSADGVDSAMTPGLSKAGTAAGLGAAGGTAWAAAKSTGHMAKGSLDATGDAARSGFGTIQDGLNNAGAATKGGLGAAGDVTKGSFDTVQGGLNNIGDAARGGLGNIKGAAERGTAGIKGSLADAGNTVQGGIGRVGDGIKNGLDNAGNTVKGGADAVTGKLSGMADDAGDAIQGGTNAAKGGSQSFWDRVRDGVNDATDAVADKADDVANQAKHQAGNLKDQADKLGQKGMDKASDVADNLTDWNS